MSTTPLEAAIPAPRGAAEPTTRTTTQHDDQPRPVRDQPGWLSLCEALDSFAGALVARYEHELCRAGAGEVPRLRRQVEQARRLEATTAAAVSAARHTTHPAPPPPRCRPCSGGSR